jgi:NAD(P)-dependent dehydrogenase (short-subunit alcohol dehydrogenase family)
MRPLGNVLITGGASGLGAATVEAVLAAGGRPLVLDRSAPSAEVDHVQADLADRAATEDAVTALVAIGGGRLQAVFTTAGIDSCGPFDEVPPDAAKFGVIGFTRALVGRIGVTLLIPGGMHTAFFDGRDEQDKPPPDAKLNRPQDVAQP